MKQIKKHLTGILMIAVLLGGCAQETDMLKKVSVAQIVEHTSLNTIRDSFADEMEQLGYIDGENIRLEYKDAGNNSATMESILSAFAGNKSDVIVAIATPTAQAAARYAQEIPVVFAAVSDPIGSGLTTSLSKPDRNMTGTMDDVQVEQILEAALQIDPDLKRLGVIYNASEANSVTNVEKAKAFGEAHGIAIQEVTVTSSNDVKQAVTTLAASCDALFSPNDNTVASAMSAAAQKAADAGVPYYTGADSMVQDGGFLTVGIDYEELGRESARMVDQLLQGKTCAELPIRTFDTDLKLYVNQTVLKQLGISLPASLAQDEAPVLIEGA